MEFKIVFHLLSLVQLICFGVNKLIFWFKIDVIDKIFSILKNDYLTVLYSCIVVWPRLISGYRLRLKSISIPYFVFKSLTSKVKSYFKSIISFWSFNLCWTQIKLSKILAYLNFSVL